MGNHKDELAMPDPDSQRFTYDKIAAEREAEEFGANQMIDYFDLEEDRLGDGTPDFSRIKTTDRWSEGVEDEENLELADVDATDELSEQTALPELLPIEQVERPTPEQLDEKSYQRYLMDN